MKKLLASCTLASGLLFAINSFAGEPPASTTTLIGFPIKFTISGTISYVPTFYGGNGYYGYSYSQYLISSPLMSINFSVATLINWLNRSQRATNYIYDYTAGAYAKIPADAYLVFDFVDNNYDDGDLAFVNSSGFYLPLEGYVPDDSFSAIYYGSSYFDFGYLYGFGGIGSSKIDQNTLAGSETDTYLWGFYFEDYNGTYFEVSGVGTDSLTSTALNGTDTNVKISGSGTGLTAGYEYGYGLSLRKSAHKKVKVTPHEGYYGDYNYFPMTYFDAQVTASQSFSGQGTEDTSVNDGFFPVQPAWQYFNNNNY